MAYKPSKKHEAKEAKAIKEGDKSFIKHEERELLEAKKNLKKKKGK